MARQLSNVRKHREHGVTCDRLQQGAGHAARLPVNGENHYVEVLDYKILWIEQQLAHQVLDPHGRAYNRTKHLRQCKEMMQTWADCLDKLEHGTEPV